MSIASPPESAAPRTVFAADVPSPYGVEPVSKDEPQIIPEPVEPPKSERVPKAASQRLVSLDAFRGLVMVLMVSAGLYIPRVVENLHKEPAYAGQPTPIWDKLAFQTDHTQWIGCSLWDLIQPSFMFMVGAALAFSVGSRRARGQSFRGMLVHAIIRSVVLVLLAVFFSSRGVGPHSHTNWLFTNVLAQIGLGYTFLFLLAWVRPRWQVAAAVAILVLYWGAFAIASKPAADVPSEQLGLPAHWQRLEGFAAHWEKNTNIAARFDKWFLNLFPQTSRRAASEPKPFTYNEGGYATLNFVPSLATMIFGLLAGELLRSRLKSAAKFGILLGAGAVGLGLGYLFFHQLAFLCPVVKRIWTPSWAIYSAGWVFLTLAIFYLVIDVARLRLWAMPLVVVGMNSIAAYCISQLMKPWVRENMNRHLGDNVFNLYGLARPYEPMIQSGLFLLFVWAVCWWMYRKKVFVKI